MAEKLFYCDTCNVHLTGQQPALQHYDGSKHRKNEALKLVRGNATESERQTGSPGSAAGYPDDGMKSETGLKSLEAAPACNIVMVPSLNPSLPPVPVTMTENVLPQTEYDFNGIGGSCHLCDIQLTSQQHADQHLAGQRHLKAKKRWEARREQLQMTVSGLCPSMKSKPIAMCQPLVCELPAKYNIGGSITKHSSNKPALPPTATASESTDVDGMQWFSCEVCDKSMNTVEMLELHRQSPPHLRKVERQQLGALSGDNTIWQSCPTCQKKLNSPTQLEIHMTHHRRPTSVSNYPPASSESRTPPLAATPGVQCHYCDICNKFVNTAVQLDLHRQSPAHQKKAALRDNPQAGNIGDNTVWQTCSVCNKRVNSMKQLDIHMDSHGPAAKSLLCGAPRGDVDTLYSDTPNQLTCTETVLRNVNMSLLAAAENIDPPIEFRDEVDVKSLNRPLNQLPQQAASQDDAGISESVMSSGSNHHTDVSQLGRNNAQQLADTFASQAAKFTSNVATIADDVVKLSNSLPLAKSDSHDLSNNETRHTSSGYLVSQAARQTGDNSATTTATDDDDDDDDEANKLVTDDDLITSGCCQSFGCVYHCELCDVHLSGDEPKNMHLTGSKHIACRQKAEETPEHNPFSPRFSFFCALCNVPFNTTKDKRQHERGQQHISRSLRCLQAPHRLMPQVILPTDSDQHCCMPDSLVTSTPRSYQEELYFKTLVADSICFLPTGIDGIA